MAPFEESLFKREWRARQEEEMQRHWWTEAANARLPKEETEVANAHLPKEEADADAHRRERGRRRKETAYARLF